MTQIIWDWEDAVHYAARYALDRRFIIDESQELEEWETDNTDNDLGDAFNVLDD